MTSSIVLASTTLPALVETGVIEPDGSPIFSATQVDTFRLCKRKWAWRYLDGIESEPHPSAQLGTEVHAQLEGWLREGKMLDMSTRAGLIAMSSLHLLPSPKSCDVERPFLIELFGFRFRGFKDFERGPEIHRSNGTWISGFVGDHKTSTDPNKWGKTAEDLRNDTQAILYAAEHLHRFEAPSVELHWNYLRTSGSPKATPVLDGTWERDDEGNAVWTSNGRRPVITRGECEPVLERTYNAAKEMAAICAQASAKDAEGALHEVQVLPPHALSLEPNAAACQAFGGCPHIERCNLSANDKIRSLFKMNDKEALLAKMANNPQLPPAGPPAATAPAINPPTAPSPFVDGIPFLDGKDWHLPGTPGYEAWKAFYASQAASTGPATPGGSATGTSVGSATPTPEAGTPGGFASMATTHTNGAATNGAAAPTTPPSTEQHLTEGLKRRRTRKVIGVNAPPKASAVGTRADQTLPGLSSLATMGQALIDLGSSLLELAGVTYADEDE